jgi:hypothetical protein
MAKYLAGLLRGLAFIFYALTILGMFSYVGLWLNALLFSAGKWPTEPNAEYFIRVNMHGTIVYLSRADQLLYYNSLSYRAVATMAVAFTANLLELCANRLHSNRRETADAGPVNSEQLLELWKKLHRDQRS